MIKERHDTPSSILSIDEAMRLATALHRAGHREDAFRIYTRVLEQVPGHADALHFIAILAHEQGNESEAIRLMTQSVAAAPDHAAFRSNLGNLLLGNGRFEDAEREYRHALELDPDRPDVLNNYAVLCKALGRYDEAERCLLRALALAEGFTDARNNLARLYVRLGRGEEAVDLSARMLAKARQRGLYDLLEQVELTAHLRARTADYDLIVSADTLVYFGVLEEVIGAAAAALSTDGLLCFTLEALGADESGDYRLRHHGRYAHARAYLESVIGRVGLIPLRLDAEILRSEGGEPVAGWLVLARRPAIRT